MRATMPIIKQIPYQEPALVLRHFSDQDWLGFLDSAKKIPHIARFSFIVFNPFIKIMAKKAVIKVNGREINGNPFLILQQQLSRYKFSRQDELPPFQGGALGYFSYDLLHHLENIPSHQSDPMNLPDMAIGLYDTVIAFDDEAKKSWIISHGLSEVDVDFDAEKAEEKCNFIMNRLEKKVDIAELKQGLFARQETIVSNFQSSNYKQAVQKVIDYIYAGDIFQANISQCFSTSLPQEISALDLYFKLREVNPAPFAAFLNYGEISIASASPERFLKLQENLVETRPIKGTRRRSIDPAEDNRLAQELLNSEKDRAENTMIVDLMRNDLSRVCQDHSVKVTKLCGLESYPAVHHLVSIIEGRLKKELDAIDLLAATFPGGSITGAPKVRSMEIIAELEPTARGPYCGSIGYIGFDGTMDTSIVIRTFLINKQQVSFQAGGGIVADSSPHDEYYETLTKASSLFKALTEEDINDFNHR